MSSEVLANKKEQNYAFISRYEHLVKSHVDFIKSGIGNVNSNNNSRFFGLPRDILKEIGEIQHCDWKNKTVTIAAVVLNKSKPHRKFWIPYDYIEGGLIEDEDLSIENIIYHNSYIVDIDNTLKEKLINDNFVAGLYRGRNSLYHGFTYMTENLKKLITGKKKLNNFNEKVKLSLKEINEDYSIIVADIKLSNSEFKRYTSGKYLIDVSTVFKTDFIDFGVLSKTIYGISYCLFRYVGKLHSTDNRLLAMDTMLKNEFERYLSIKNSEEYLADEREAVKINNFDVYSLYSELENTNNWQKK